MFSDPQTLRTLVIAVPAFGLVLSVWIAFVLVWNARRRSRAEAIENRIGLPARGASEGGRVLRLWRDEGEAVTLVPGSQRLSFSQRLAGMLSDAGWTASPQGFVLRVAAAAVIVSAVTFAVSHNLLPAAGGAVVVVLLAWTYLQRCIAKRSALFERQFADSLELAARSLRVGHPLVGALHLISEEFEAPVGPLFGEVCQQQALGRPLDEALRTAAAGHASDDLKLFATAVIIQLRSGGSLADMMERLAVVIRERIRLTRRVRVLTAQTQFSKRVLQALPLFVFVLLNFINPDYMRPLYQTDTGRHVLFVAAGCLLVGSWLMNKLSVIRY